jgi:hypothetical protein
MANKHPSLGFSAGFALDLTTADENGVPWDFSIAARRRAAIRKVQEEKPYLLVGSPMRAAFCILQQLNYGKMAAERVERLITEALVHFHFCFILHEMQRSSGRLFLHEHPATATSWKDPKVCEFVEKEDVWTTVMRMCQYGMVSERNDGTWGPVY